MWFIWVVGAVGLVFVAIGVNSLSIQMALDGRGVTATGTITNKTRTYGKSRSYTLYYSFNANGAPLTGQSNVTYSVYSDAQVGMQTPVMYLPESPEVNRCAGSSGERSAWMLIMMGPLIFVIGIIVTYSARRSAARRAQF